LLTLLHAFYRSSGGKEQGDQAGSSSHKSQDAAVGYLVHLLKSARPLRDSSYSSHTSRAESIDTGSNSSSMSRRTSDALEEVESFKEIKENLLARSRTRLQDSLDKPQCRSCSRFHSLTGGEYKR
jgi:autophagy-related protein 13